MCTMHAPPVPRFLALSPAPAPQTLMATPRPWAILGAYINVPALTMGRIGMIFAMLSILLAGTTTPVHADAKSMQMTLTTSTWPITKGTGALTVAVLKIKPGSREFPTRFQRKRSVISNNSIAVSSHCQSAGNSSACFRPQARADKICSGCEDWRHSLSETDYPETNVSELIAPVLSTANGFRSNTWALEQCGWVFSLEKQKRPQTFRSAQ